MRFSGFSSRAPSFRLGTSLGEQKVVVTVAAGAVCLKTRGGEVLESHLIESVAWHACILPPSKERCLVLRVPGAGAPGSSDGCKCGAPRELLLRTKSTDKVEQLERLLRTASLQAADHSAAEGKSPAQQSLLSAMGERLPGLSSQQQSRPHSSGNSGRQEEELQACQPDPRSLSFGSPVTAMDSEADNDSPQQPPAGAANCGSRAVDGRPRSAPGSPVLPGLPLVQVGRQLLASAPVSPAHPSRLMTGGRLTSLPEQQQRQARGTATLCEALPVRLLSFGSRHAGAAAGHADQQQQGQGQQQQQEHKPNRKEEPPLQELSNIQRLEQAVAQLSSELAQARTGGGGSGSSRAATLVQPTPGPCDLPPSQQGSTANAACRQAEAPAQRAASPSPRSCDAHITINASGSSRHSIAADRGKSVHHWEALLQEENSLLLQQQAALQAQLGRMQGQLSAAAADNVLLAQQAAEAVQQLQAATDALAGSQQRETQLRESLGSAVGQCEAVGRELAGLSGKLEGRAAQCQELRASVDALSAEKTVLTAALTTAQLQLKEATPAGFVMEVAELRQQAQAAQKEAATAKAGATVASARVAEAERREAEAEGHMQEAARCMAEAQAVRAAGLAREEALAAEVRSLRQQLAGQLGEDDPAKAMQQRIDQLAGANAALQQERAALAAQLQQLQAVGQELSGSCRALEARLQGTTGERDSLQAALAQARAAHEAASQGWETQHQQLEAALGAANGRLAGSEDSGASLKLQVQELQTQLESLQGEARDARAEAARREQELQAELRLLVARSEAAAQAARDRSEATAAAAGAEAARQHEALRAKELEIEAAKKEAATLAAEQQRLQEDLRRARDERTVVARELQLEASSAKAEAAGLAQELQVVRDAAQQAQRAAEEGRRSVQQAQAQAQAAVAAHTALTQQRKELQGRLDRLAVEAERAARARETAELQCGALQQQCRLLEAVARGQASLGGGRSPRRGGRRGGGSKENGSMAEEAFGIKARRLRGLALSTSSSD
ncbi:hypothetical protein ABPG77_003382 [Micractinium sp. CCAP 211/92]